MPFLPIFLFFFAYVDAHHTPAWDTTVNGPQYSTTGPGNPIWGGNMFGNPFTVMPEMMVGMATTGVTPPPDMVISTTRKPTRREFLRLAASKRGKDGAKVEPKLFPDFNEGFYKSQGPPKDELEMFVDSIQKMATSFHRLEFRLTKAIKMVDKFLVQNK